MLLPLDSAQSHPVCLFNFPGWLITRSSMMCRPWPCCAACLKLSPGYRGAQTPMAPSLSVPPPWPPTADTYDRHFFPVCPGYLGTYPPCRLHDFLSFAPQQPSFTSSGSCSSMSDPGLGTGGWSIGTETWVVNRGICLPSGLGFRWLLQWGRKGVSTGCDCGCALPEQLSGVWPTGCDSLSQACSNRVDAPAVLPLLTSVACCSTVRNLTNALDILS